MPLVYDALGGLLVEARVNGASPVRLILDTGASSSALASDYVDRLGLTTIDGDEVEGSAGIVKARRTSVEIEVAPLAPIHVDATVYGFASYDPQCVGILGYELLSRAPFRVRYSTKELVWNARAPSATIPMDVSERIPRIRARIRGIEVPLRIDTGASLPPGPDSYLNVTTEQARAIGLTEKPVAVFTASGTGGATLELPVHRLDECEIAGRHIQRAFAIVQPQVGYFARADAIGFLGNSVLDKLGPFFDYARGVFGVAS